MINFNLGILDFILINWEGNKLFGFIVIKFWYLPDMVLWLISCLDYSYYMIFLIWMCFWWICWKIGFMQRVWLHKGTSGVCLSIASKGLAIIEIGDWRYWNHIPTEESRWDSFNFLTFFFLVFMYWFFNGNGRKIVFFLPMFVLDGWSKLQPTVEFPCWNLFE